MEKNTASISDRVKSKEESSSRQNVSFKFTKHSSKLLLNNKLSNHESDNFDRELILAVEKKKIKSTVPKEEPKELVIPPIQKNQWRKSKNESSKASKADGPASNSLNELAIRELLQESANKKLENTDVQKSAVPMVIQNKIPEGFETDDNLNVELRAEESTLEDYESIPIDEFGAAILRGLGCKPGDPMGNKNKKFVEPIEAVQRSKGLGLGADKQKAKSSVSHQLKEEGELKLVAGAYIHIIRGVHQGKYGQIEGLDETRAIIKLGKKNESISLPLLYFELISEKEYQKERRVINKKSYDKYKKEQDIRNDVKSKEEALSLEDGIECTLSKGLNSHENTESRKPRKRKHHDREESENDSYHGDRHSYNWVRALLRVRIVDENYKRGKYYEQKVTVEDVLTPRSCVCRTDDGKYLEDISPSMLETVIPRSELANVMIVDGKHKGQLGIVLKRDKKNHEATVQLLSDREKVTKLNYNSICEYVGDVSQFD